MGLKIGRLLGNIGKVALPIVGGVVGGPLGAAAGGALSGALDGGGAGGALGGALLGGGGYAGAQQLAEANRMRREAIAQHQADYDSRAPGRRAALSYLEAGPAEREDLSSLYASENPFSRPVARVSRGGIAGTAPVPGYAGRDPSKAHLPPRRATLGGTVGGEPATSTLPTIARNAVQQKQVGPVRGSRVGTLVDMKRALGKR